MKRPVTKKGAAGDFFFFIFEKKKVFPKMDNIFLSKKNKCGKKINNYGRLTGHNYGHPLDRKQTFFMDSLKYF